VPVQVFAEEARDFTRRLCEGFKVYLVYDRQKKGKYGRTLAYVYLENGQMVNEELLKRGYAYVLRRFPFKRKGEFLILQEEARKENRGLWSLNLSPGRLANIATRFNKLSEKVKRQFDKQIDRLLIKYGKDENELK
jgi:endonuclease YncB( thermonuclease family)